MLVVPGGIVNWAVKLGRSKNQIRTNPSELGREAGGALLC